MIQALCLTLIHSLWQGFLAAVAAGIIILSTRKSKAAVRYNLLTADLILFLLIAGCTFFHELGGGGSGPVTGRVVGEEETTILSGIQLQVHAEAASSTGFIGQAETFLQTHASTVVLIWMVCLLLQLVQLMGGLYQMGRLRRRRVFAPGAVWQERLQLLANQLGIRKPVELIQSARISIPVTFGFLKPSILVPLGMLTNLPADQVEAILLHELAHIRRSDYLANILLHITEAVFFFNPGLRWIATLIREEREACCDDMVLMGTTDRNSYFDALVAFRENAVLLQGYALQLGKGRSELLWRIRRMLNQENKKLHIMEKAILSFGLTAILAIGLISMRTAEQQAEKRQGIAQQAWQGNDTLPMLASASERRVKAQFPTISTKVEDNGSQKQYKIDATDADGNTFELTKVNGEVTELIINGKVIPQKDFDQYLYIFEEIESLNHETAGEQEGQDKVALAERDLEKAQERLEAANQEQAEAQEHREQEQARQQEKLEEEQARQQDSLEKQQEAMEKAAEVQQEKVEQEAARQQEIAEKQREAQQAIIEKQQEEQQERLEQQQQEQQERIEKQQEAIEKQQEVQQEKQEKVRYSADRVVYQIIGDMIQQGLVESKEAVHAFSLDDNGMTLNGTELPADTYKLFRDKYIKNANSHYYYSHKGTGTSTDFSQGN